MYGFQGNILHVNLTQGISRSKTPTKIFIAPMEVEAGWDYIISSPRPPLRSIR